jgi:hypothetical protein
MILDWVAGTIIIDKYEKGVNVKVIVILVSIQCSSHSTSCFL